MLAVAQMPKKVDEKCKNMKKKLKLKEKHVLILKEKR